MGGSRSHSDFFLENRPKTALNQYSVGLLIFWSSIALVPTMCILSYALLKVVAYYDLSVLSMSVMGFQKNQKFGWWWVGGVRSIHFFLVFLELFNFAKPLSSDGETRAMI